MRFPTLLRAFRGRKVEDRGRGVAPPFRPVPVTPSRFESLRFGISYCPQCGEKVAVLCDGVCRDCGPDVA